LRTLERGVDGVETMGGEGPIRGKKSLMKGNSKGEPTIAIQYGGEKNNLKTKNDKKPTDKTYSLEQY